MSKGFAKFLIFIVVIFLIINGIISMTRHTKTQVAFSGLMEKSFSLEGIIARNETVITAPQEGILQSKVSENEMVKKNKHVASVYVGEIDDESSQKLSEINQRINELTSHTNGDAHSNDAHKVEANITTKINDIIVASNNRNAEKVSALKKDLQILADRKTTTTGTPGDMTTILAELRAEKEHYENQFSTSKHDLTAPEAGLYSTDIDGYEESLSSDNAGKITVGEYQILKKKKTAPKADEDSYAKCKIISNYQWTILAPVNDATASELEVGQSVYIRFDGEAADIRAKISSISPKESNKYIIGITSSENCDYAMSQRFINFELICAKYKGIKIPVNAIQVKGDVTGVYVAENSVARFKEVKVLYRDGKNAIIEQNNNKNGYLLLYDKVIIKTKDITDGTKIE